jgi:excisionase family DNA binding protein
MTDQTSDSPIDHDDSARQGSPERKRSAIGIDEFMTVPEVAARLRVSSRWVYDAAARHVFPSAMFEGMKRFKRVDIEHYTAAAFALGAR